MTKEEIFDAVREIVSDEGISDVIDVEDSTCKEGTIYNDNGFLNICDQKTIAFCDIASIRSRGHKEGNTLLHLVVRAMFSSLRLDAVIDLELNVVFGLSYTENDETFHLTEQKAIIQYLNDYHRRRAQLDFVDWQLIKMPNLLVKGLEENTIVAWDRKALNTIKNNNGWFKQGILFSYAEIAFTCNDEELYGCFRKETAIRLLVEEDCVEAFLNWFQEENGEILSEQESYELVAMFMSEIDDTKDVYTQRSMLLS